MAKTYSDKVYSGTLATTEAIITTIATNTTFIMKGFWISNANASDQTVTFKIDDKRLIPTKAVPTKDTLIRSDLNIAIATGQTIKLTGAVATDMDYYIWGVNEVTS